MTKKTKKKATGKVNGRNKGASFERKIAKQLSEWWGYEFHRSPASGGLRWGKDNRVVGDIVTPKDEDGNDVIFPFTVECKKVEGWNFEQLLKGTGEVVDWWIQANEDYHRLDDSNKTPLLVFSKNYSPVFIMMFTEEFNKIFSKDSNYFDFKVRVNILGEKQSHEVTVGLFDRLTSIPKEKIIEILVE